MPTSLPPPPEVREFLTGVANWLRPSFARRVLGRARRLIWAVRDWWRGPIQTYRVGDVISVGDKHPTITRIEGKTLHLSDGSTLTVS